MKLYYIILLQLLALALITTSATQAQSTPETTSLEATIISRPTKNVGTWLIGAVNVEVTNETQIFVSNGSLEVGGCVTLDYVVVGTTNIALKIQGEAATVCNSGEPTATPNPSSETTWQGKIELQGRTDHSGAAIFLSEQPCSTATFNQSQAVSAADGTFQVSAPSSQIFQCLQVSNALYLTLRQDITSPMIAPITLKAGDVNGDNIINILDIATLAAHYDQNYPSVDLNADGKIDIFDLVTAASNFQ